MSDGEDAGSGGGVADFLRSAGTRWGARMALDDGGRRWSYGELDRAVDLVASRLRGHGARPGALVAMVAPATGSTVVLLHAVARTGSVAAPLSARLTVPELASALQALAPAVLVREPEGHRAGGWGASQVSVSTVVSVQELLDDLDGGPEISSGESPEVPAGASGSAAEASAQAVLWTSGTAGTSRGVVLTGPNLIASARASGRRLELGPRDRWHLSLSPAHVGGLALVTRAAILGSAVVTRGPFAVETFRRLVEEDAITHASLVPTMLRRVLEDRGRPPPSSLRCVLVGGARAPPDVVEEAIASSLPVALTYGLTEASSQVATAPPALVRRKPGTVGPPLEGVEVRVDEGGEILVRGPTVARGYVGDDRRLTDPDGWLRTGDLGEMDAEGDLWVTGRGDDRILSGGVVVDPVEVEEALRVHPGVRDVAVCGVADAEWGERVEAVVVKARAHDPPGGTELERLARSRLAGPKVPRRFHFVDELPRHRNGKLDRGRLRALLEGS